jgi:hypothetical protein
LDSNKLEQYGIIMSYLQYENSMYWGRANFFLIACTALFGFVAMNLPTLTKATRWESLLALLAASGAGLALSLLWKLGLQSGEFWIHHWHSVLKDLEQGAFEDLTLLRQFQPNQGSPKHVSARKVARSTLLVFYVLWGVLLVYSLVCIYVKIKTSS